ncbi:MAG: ABC transporter ATP-binding protein [Bacteroidota bacterium]
MASSLSPLSSLNKYFIKYKWHFLGGIFFVAISNVFGIIPAKLIRYALDASGMQISWYKLTSQFQQGATVESTISFNLLVFAMLVLLMALLKGFFMFLMRQTLIVASRHIEYDMKNEIYGHYQELDHAFYSSNSTGDLMNRISEDVGRVRSYVGPAVMYTVNLVVTMILVISAMVQVNAQLTLYTLLPLPILSLVIYKVEHVINRKSERVQSGLSDMSTLVQETFSGIRVVKAYASEKEVVNAFSNQTAKYKNATMELVRTNALFQPSLVLLIGLSTVITIGVGGYMVMLGQITLGNIAEFVIYVGMLTWPVAALGWVVSLMQRAAASQQRINEFLDTKPEIKSLSKDPIEIKGELEFRNVSFKYPNSENWVLENVSFKVAAGRSSAITGTTGSGKSTVALLMMRFMDPTSGEIFIDGKNLKTVNLQSYRSQVGYVPQEVFLFSESIADNIGFGAQSSLLKEPETLQQRVRDVAEIACVAKDVAGFPQGYETMVGERGITLSGGQKQRISIARAMMANPKMMILDDCLSAVDTVTEELILSAFSSQLENKTCVFISHRISTVKSANEILVLHDGKLFERGSHAELLAKKGVYSEMFDKQQLEAFN